VVCLAPTRSTYPPLPVPSLAPLGDVDKESLQKSLMSVIGSLSNSDLYRPVFSRIFTGQRYASVRLMLRRVEGRGGRGGVCERGRALYSHVNLRHARVRSQAECSGEGGVGGFEGSPRQGF